tara:strand:+ start:762 stop:917 length:156 start_codon:yes stop_codon:yes gene_type:complete
MSDFMIYLEDIGAIQSTDHAFDTMSVEELTSLMELHMSDYLEDCRVLRTMW